MILQKKFFETDFIKMLQFLIDNIFTLFGGVVFKRHSIFLKGTNCVPFLSNLFIYSYEVDFIQGLLKKNEKKLTRSFNFKFRYSVYTNNFRFGIYLPLSLK